MTANLVYFFNEQVVTIIIKKVKWTTATAMIQSGHNNNVIKMFIKATI